MKPPARLPAPLPLRAVFGIPAVIALVTIVGLVTALLDDGLFDAVSWVALAVPLLVAGRSWHRRRRSWIQSAAAGDLDLSPPCGGRSGSP